MPAQKRRSGAFFSALGAAKQEDDVTSQNETERKPSPFSPVPPLDGETVPRLNLSAVTPEDRDTATRLNSFTGTQQEGNTVTRQDRQAASPESISTVLPLNSETVSQSNRFTAQPLNRETVSPSSGSTVRTQNSDTFAQGSGETVKRSDRGERGEYQKTTFYLTPGQLDTLDDLAYNYKRRTGKRIDRQDIVRFLVDHAQLETLLAEW
jgi:hypothetical protein